MAKFSIFATALAMGIAQCAAFAPTANTNVKASRELRMMSKDDVTNTLGSSMVAASLFLSSVFTPEAALALSFPQDNAMDFGPSSSLIAARSGGRAGGRSSASTMRSPPPRQSTTTINRTTVIQSPSPSVIVAPPVVVGSPMGYGYGYNPLMPSPLGAVGVGLEVAGAVGREMREMRQEDQLRQARNEVEAAKQREYMLEQRLNNMEMQQNAQNAAAYAAAAATRN